MTSSLANLQSINLGVFSFSIGRVTQGLLANVAANIDIVEPVGKFTAQLRGQPGVRHIFNVGLEEWAPAADAPPYNLVWVQWCLGHLTDEQLVRCLRRCAAALAPGTGVIVVKENLSTSGEDVFDPVDSCVTRFVLSFFFLPFFLLTSLANGKQEMPLVVEGEKDESRLTVPKKKKKHNADRKRRGKGYSKRPDSESSDMDRNGAFQRRAPTDSYRS